MAFLFDRLRHLMVAVLAPLAAACGSDTQQRVVADTPDASAPPYAEDTDSDTPPAPDAAPLPPDATCGTNLTIHRTRAWPGRGLQLTVALTTNHATPAAADTPPLLRTASGDTIPLTTAPLAPPAGITGILLSPTTTFAAVEAFFDTLVPDTVVLWGMSGDTPIVLAEASSDRAHQLARARSFLASQHTASTRALAETATTLANRLMRLAGADGPADRNLVLLGFPPTATIAPTATEGLDTVRILSVDAGNDPNATRAIANTIASRRHAFHRLGACLPVAVEPGMTLVWGNAECPVTIGSASTHLLGVDCTTNDIVADAWPSGDTIELVFTSEEAAIWSDRRNTKNRDPFALAVRIDQGQPLRASARLRGQTSMDCERKSYNVNLDGSSPHRLMPGVSHDRFYLIAMCRDVGYFNQLFADRLGQELGFFPLRFRVVRLVANGEEHGAYMLLEKPDDALVQDMVEPFAVIRRRFDSESEPSEIEWHTADVTEAEVTAQWRTINDDALEGPVEGLEERLANRIDFDTYLRWVAFNRFMRNGDYVDEAIFHGSREHDGTAAGPWFRLVGWDPDDLFSDCHHGGRFALEDPHRLVYCAEADIDHALFRSPAIYTRYVQHLESLMTELTPARLRAAMDATRASMFAVVSTDAVAAAMVELVASRPESATAAGFEAVVTELTDAMLEKAEAARAMLTGRIATWRAGSTP